VHGSGILPERLSERNNMRISVEDTVDINGVCDFVVEVDLEVCEDTYQAEVIDVSFNESKLAENMTKIFMDDLAERVWDGHSLIQDDKSHIAECRREEYEER
jgi:hypothetical protein